MLKNILTANLIARVRKHRYVKKIYAVTSCVTFSYLEGFNLKYCKYFLSLPF